MFDWKRYIDLADKLYCEGQHVDLSEPGDEAKLRSAISRAYYGAFNEARQRLELRTRTRFSEGPEAHKEVQHKLAEGDERLQRIAETLRRLRLERNRADYRDYMDRDIGGLSAWTDGLVGEAWNAYSDIEEALGASDDPRTAR